MIKVENLHKEFVVSKKKPGFLGAIQGLFKREKEIKKAVDGVSFHIAKGEMVGYIGANGAGKSTTIKMMTGILVPTSGQCSVGGIVPYQERMRNARQIGVVFGQRTQLWWDLPVRETFTILKEIYGVPAADFKDRLGYLEKVLSISEFEAQPVRTLSLGQRMRADLAAAMIHNPSVLFLDEPTIGLDIVVKEKMLDAIKDLNRQFNTTVILTTHDMEDIEELCKRIIIIDKGKKVYDGGLKEIKDRYGFMTTVQMEVKDSHKARELAWQDAFELDGEDFSSRVEDNILSVRFNKNKASIADVIGFALPRIPVLDVKIQETQIEEIVKEIYAGKVL